MKWKETVIDLGEVKQKSKCQFYYKSIGDLQVKEIKAGCPGCTVVNGYKNRELTVTFTADPIPKHFKKKDFQHIMKFITVVYDNGQRDTLSFKAKIVR